MQLKNYHQRPTWDIHQKDEIFNGLSKFEQDLAQRLDLIKIKGKRGRHVLVIMTSDIAITMKLLAEHRNHCNKKN